MSDRRAFSVAVFARHAGRVLLISHARLRTWLPVGGEIEANETPLEAARRELREETGLEGRFTRLGELDGAPAGLIGYEEHPAGSKGLHLNFAFVADVDSEVVVSNGEFGAHEWVTSSGHLDAPRNVHQLVALALERDLGTAWLAAGDLTTLQALYEHDARPSVLPERASGRIIRSPERVVIESDATVTVLELSARSLIVAVRLYRRSHPGSGSFE